MREYILVYVPGTRIIQTRKFPALCLKNTPPRQSINALSLPLAKAGTKLQARLNPAARARPLLPKSAMEAAQKQQAARGNSQIDTSTGKYRTDNAKSLSKNKKESRIAKTTKESRIGNVVKGTGKQLGASYLNAVVTPNADAKVSKAKVKAESSWGVMEKQSGKSNDRKYNSSFYKTAAQVAKEKETSERIQKQTSQMQKAYEEGVKNVQSRASALRQSGSEDIEKAKKGLGKLGQFGVDLASQTMMWGSDAAIGAATGTGLLTPMFVRSFGDASMTAREAGATHGQQMFAGLAAGSIEAATEKLFSPYEIFKKSAGAGIADNLAEKASYALSQKIASKLVKSGVPSNALYKAVRNTVKGVSGMAEEGTEEVLSDLAQPLYERIYDKEALKQYGTSEYWKNTAYDFGMGAAMAGVLGGGHAAANKARGKVTGQDQTQTAPYTEEEKTQTIEVAKAQGEDSDAYKYAHALEQQQAEGKEILDAQVDDLTRMVVEEQMETEKAMSDQQEAEERKQLQLVQQKAGETEGYLPKSGNLTTVEARHVNETIALRVDTNARRIEQNLINVFHADPQTAYAQAESIARIKTGTATASDLSVAAVNNTAARAAIMRELGIKLPATNQGTMKTLAEYEGVTRAVQKQNILKQARQSARAELFETFTMGMDDTTADVFAEGMEKVQIADMPKYMEAFATYFEGGRVNYDYDRIPIAKAYKGSITEEIKMAAYNAGNQIYLAQQEQAAAAQAEIVKGERTSGTLEISDQNAKKLGKEQTAALKMMTEVTGKSVVVLDQIDAGKRRDVANGKYQDGVIYISAKSQAPVFDVLKHELTHNLQETAPEAYRELKQYVFKKFYESDRALYEKKLQEMISRYAAGGVELTMSEAEDELLADATDAFFRDYNAIQALVMENRSLGEKLLDGIRSLLDTFHRLATGSQSEEKENLKGDWLEAIDALEEAERLWVKALNESIGVKSGKASEKFQLKSNDIREFDMTKEKALANMRAVTAMEPVANLTLHEFNDPGKKLPDQVMEYYDSIGGSVQNDILGEVLLTKRGIKESWAHRKSEGKPAAFKSVPEVIENGKIIDAQYDWKSRGYDTVVLAAPITIDDVPYYEAVVVKRVKTNGIQRFNVHDLDTIKMEQTAPSQALERTPDNSTAPLNSLLQQLNSVNSLTEKDIVSDEGRFQLKDEKEELRKQLTAEKELSAKLRAEFKRSKIAVPDQKQTGKAVTALMDAYLGKRLPKLHQSIMQDINQLFSEMRKPDGNWNLVDDLCKNVADKIVSNMEILHDEYWNQYSDLRSTLHKTTLKLDEARWKDIMDFEDFRKAHFGTVRISKSSGVSIDTFYQELSETYPELFDASEYTNEIDQLYNIIDTVEGMKPYTEDYSAGEIGEFADTIAADVLQMSYDLNQKETFADKKYNEKIQAINKERVKAKAKTREKLDLQKEMLTSKARAEKAAALAKERERNLAKIDKIKAENKEMMQRQRTRSKERRDKKEQFYKDKIKKVREQYRDRRDRKYYTSRIEAYSQWLSDSLLRPTDSKHIPENYRKAVAEMLESFDFSTDRTDAYTEKHGASKRTLKLAALNQAYSELMKQESGMIEPDDEIAKLISDLSVALEGKRFADLNTDQLAGVYRLVKNIRFAISSVNKVCSEGLREKMREKISDYGAAVIAESQAYHHENKGGAKATIGQFINWSNTTSLDAFMLMGNTMQELWQNMRSGFDRHVDNATTGMNFMRELSKEYKVKDWIDDKARPQKFEVGGRTIELVPSQIMSLYCLMQREQAVNHIIGGSGITSAPLPVIRKKRQKITKAWSQDMLDQSHVIPTLEEVNAIIGTLTEDQKKVADELQNFMSTVCADWGNETSVRLYGYKKFKEKNYFPIKSSDAFLEESFDSKTNPSKLKNVGFTKNTVTNANNPIVLDDIFSVFTQHVNTMSMYNALVPAITDFERIFNFKQIEGGKQTASVKQALRQAFGKDGVDYITQFMKDVNQNYVRNRDHALANKLVANYKKAKIGANLRVLVQQPTAFTRAGAIMDMKYLIEAAANLKSLPALNKRAKEEMQEHCQIARWKSWGFYNTDIARDMRDIFLDKTNIVDKLFMDMYGSADDLTWSIIWRAVKKETEKSKPELEVGSNAYWKAVNDRFSHVIDRTQVVDSVFHRSQIMRKPDLFSKTLTSFMAEPTKTWNLLRTEYTLASREWSQGNKAAAVKRVSHVMAVHLVTAAFTGAAAALIDALRGAGEDDDDKDFYEKWVAYAGQGFLDNANPLGLLPGVRDLLSLAQGYDVSRMDMAGFADLANSLNYWKSDSASTYFALKKTVGGIASVTGLPVGSLWRDVEAIAEETAKLFVPEEKVEFVMKQLRYNINDSRNRSQFAKVYAKAERKGDTGTAREIQQTMLGHGTDEKKWSTSVKTQAKNLAAKRAAQLVIDGNEKEARKVIQQCCNEYGGEYEKLWAKVEGEVAKRRTIFQQAYDATLARLISGGR